jgi:hypothetical protein
LAETFEVLDVGGAAADPPRQHSPIVGLNGTADAAGLPTLVQLLSSLQESGCVTVWDAHWEGQLFLDAGRVVGASLVTRDDAVAIEALVEALPDGCFTFSSGLPSPSSSGLPSPSEAPRAARLAWPARPAARQEDAEAADPVEPPAAPELLLADDPARLQAAPSQPAEPAPPGWLRVLKRADPGRPALAILLVTALLAGPVLTLRPNRNPQGVTAVSAQVSPPLQPTAIGAPGPDANPTAAPTDADAGMLLDEHFADNAHNWPSDPQGTAWLEDGAYHIMTRQAGQFVALGAPVPDVLSDVVVSATFHRVSGSAGAYGIIVRDQGPGPRDGANQAGWYYLLAANDKREVGIWRRENDRWTDLLAWQAADAVRPGTESNELTVGAAGDRLTFLVNGRKVASSTDRTLSAGHVGVFVGGDNHQVSLDRFAVQTP